MGFAKYVKGTIKENKAFQVTNYLYPFLLKLTELLVF